MFSIIEISKQQFLIKKGDILCVPHINAKQGEVKDAAVFLHSENDKDVVIKDDANSKKVSFEILDHIKGKKVTAFKMKRRKGFRKKKGHRTDYTKILIKDIT